MGETRPQDDPNMGNYRAIRILLRVRRLLEQEATRLRKAGDDRLADAYDGVRVFIGSELLEDPFIAGVLTKLQDQQTSEKAFGKRERRTLLTIIGALAEAAKIDLSHPSKAAGIVEECAQRLGVRLPARTIEEHLKRVAEAMEERSE